MGFGDGYSPSSSRGVRRMLSFPKSRRCAAVDADPTLLVCNAESSALGPIARRVTRKDLEEKPLDDVDSVRLLRPARVVASARTLTGRFHGNEDRWRVVPFERDTDQTDPGIPVPPKFHSDLVVLLVCDGHDGPTCADYVSANFAPLFFACLGATAPEVERCYRYSCSDGNRSITEAAREAICGLGMRDSVANACRKALNEIEKSFLKTPYPSSGACAITVTLYGDRLYCANLGDCRSLWIEFEDGVAAAPDSAAALLQSLRFVWLSRDLKASDREERKRIQRLGGFVANDRISGILEPSRTIGDYDVKSRQPTGVVSIVPEVRVLKMRKSGLLLIGTDGIWNEDTAEGHLKDTLVDFQHWRDLAAYLLDSRPEIDQRRIGVNAGSAASGYSAIDTKDLLSALASKIVLEAQQNGSLDDCTCLTAFVTPGVCSETYEPSLDAPARLEEEDNRDLPRRHGLRRFTKKKTITGMSGPTLPGGKFFRRNDGEPEASALAPNGHQPAETSIIPEVPTNPALNTYANTVLAEMSDMLDAEDIKVALVPDDIVFTEDSEPEGTRLTAETSGWKPGVAPVVMPYERPKRRAPD